MTDEKVSRVPVNKEKIKELFLAKGGTGTQGDLAKELGRNRSRLSHDLNKGECTISLACKLADYFDVSIDDLAKEPSDKKTILVWHKLPELPNHSCYCICIMNTSARKGASMFEFSGKHGLFNASDEHPEYSIPTEHVYAWAEIELPNELIKWANEGHEEEL